MTPREAFSIVHKCAIDTADAPTEALPDALSVLERMVSKDEADTKYMRANSRPTPVHVYVCTCGTVVPCAWPGHS